MSRRELKLYRPSNGSEGDWFQAQFCDRCVYDREFRERKVNGCRILAESMVFEIDDPDYPKEWRYGADGNPTCTKFREDDGDDDDRGDRPLPVPPDPRQLVLIADPTEIISNIEPAPEPVHA